MQSASRKAKETMERLRALLRAAEGDCLAHSRRAQGALAHLGIHERRRQAVLGAAAASATSLLTWCEDAVRELRLFARAGAKCMEGYAEEEKVSAEQLAAAARILEAGCESGCDSEEEVGPAQRLLARPGPVNPPAWFSTIDAHQEALFAILAAGLTVRDWAVQCYRSGPGSSRCDFPAALQLNTFDLEIVDGAGEAVEGLQAEDVCVCAPGIGGSVSVGVAAPGLVRVTYSQAPSKLPTELHFTVSVLGLPASRPIVLQVSPRMLLLFAVAGGAAFAFSVASSCCGSWCTVFTPSFFLRHPPSPFCVTPPHWRVCQLNIAPTFRRSCVGSG